MACVSKGGLVSLLALPMLSCVALPKALLFLVLSKLSGALLTVLLLLLLLYCRGGPAVFWVASLLGRRRTGTSSGNGLVLVCGGREP
jgi:hypothetical protein